MQQHLRNNQLFEVVATPDVDVEDPVVGDVVAVVLVVDVVVVVDVVEDTLVPPPVMQAGPEYVFLNVLYFSLRVWNTLGFYTQRSF